MQIHSTDRSRSRSIEDLDDAPSASPTGKPQVDRRSPDWDRIPTLDAGALAAAEGASHPQALTT